MSEVFPRKKISEFCRLEIGGTPSRANADFWSDDGIGHPWVSIADMGPRLVAQTSERITEASITRSNVKLVPKGTVLMSFKLTLGRMGIAGTDLFTNEAIAAFYPDAAVATRDWLFYALPEAVASAQFDTAVKGATLNKAKLRDLAILVPPTIAEQHGIASVLSALDEQIEQTEALIEKFGVTRAGLVRDLLAEVQSSPRLSLKQLAEVSGGVTLGREFTGSGIAEYPYLRVANVQDGRIDLTEVKTIRIPIVSAAKAMLQAGDVLMNEGGDFDKLGRGAVWNGQIPNCLHQNHVFRVRCDKTRLLPGFLSLWAASDFGKRFFILASKQSTNLASINSTQLKSFPVLTPFIAKQQEIMDAVESIDDIQTANKAEAAKLRLQKQGLMRDLLTGKVRVNRVGNA